MLATIKITLSIAVMIAVKTYVPEGSAPVRREVVFVSEIGIYLFILGRRPTRYIAKIPPPVKRSTLI